MHPQIEVFRGLIKEFTGRTNRPCVIAGGAVRDYLIGRAPRDYDVFVLDAAQAASGWADNLVLKKAQTKYSTFKTFNVVSGLQTETIAPVQFILTNYKTAGELCDTFDWNICMFYYDGAHTHMKMDPKKIVGGTLELNPDCKVRPLLCLDRAATFATRYNMQIRTQDVVKIMGDMFGTEATLPKSKYPFDEVGIYESEIADFMPDYQNGVVTTASGYGQFLTSNHLYDAVTYIKNN